MPIWLSTERVAQVSGNYDPDGLTHYGDSMQWGIEGIDLGASTVHDGKTFIYFGDVPWIPPPMQEADAIGIIDDIHVPRHANITAARQHHDPSNGFVLTSAFFIDDSGGLCVAWVVGDATWRHPVRIGGSDLAPPGAHIAAAQQLDNQLDVFFIGKDGGLYVAWVVEDGIWQGPQLISATRIAEPGGRLAAAKQSGNQLDVFFIGKDRLLNVAWVVGAGIWQGPQPVGNHDIPYPQAGAGIAVCRQGAKQLDVFFVGQDTCLYVAWSNPDIENSKWQGPQRITPPDAQASIPGAHLVAFNQTPIQVTVMYVDLNHALTSMWVIEGSNIWQGPALAVPGFHPARPGAQLAASPHGVDQWDTFVVNQDGGVDVYWSTGGQPWKGPQPIAPANTTFDDTGIAAVSQLDELLTVLFAGKAGELLVSWVGGFGDAWHGPVSINPDMLGLRFVTQGGRFVPFTIKGTPQDPNQPWLLLTNETPTGAFSYGRRVYVFVVAGGVNSISYLTSSESPENAEPYKLEFAFSDDAIGDRRRFLQVAPVVVRTHDVEGLQSEREEGVLLFGHGVADPSTPAAANCVEPSPGHHAIHLAFMPIIPGQGPSKQETLYYSNGSWTHDQASASPLITTCYYWTSVSAARLPGTGKWILLRQLASPANIPVAFERPIVARIADQPRALATAPDIEIFNPQRERAWDRYMFGPHVPDAPRNDPNFGHPAFAYGAFLLSKYTRYDPESGILTIFYLMSTGRPYQVQLMRSEIIVRDVPDVHSLAGQMLNLSSQLATEGRRVEAIAPAQRAVNVLRGLEPPPAAAVAHWALFALALHTLALRLLEAQRVEAALPPAAEAVEVYRRAAASGADVPSIANPLLNLSSQLATHGRPVDAIAPVQASVGVLRPVEPPPAAAVAHWALFALALHTLALRLLEAQRVWAALLPAAEAVEVYRRAAASGADVPSIANPLLNLSSQLATHGRPVDAIAPVQASVDVLRRVEPPPAAAAAHWSLFALALHTLALRLLKAQRVEAALPPAAEAVEVYRRAAASGADVPSIANPLLNLSSQLATHGRPVDAIAPVQASVDVLRRVEPPPAAAVAHWTLFALALHTLALRLLEAQRVEAALPPAAEAVEVYRRAAASGADVPSIANPLLNLSSQLATHGRPVDAIAPAQASVDVLRRVEPPPAAAAAHWPLFALALHTLAVRLLEAQRVADALPPAEEALALYRRLAGVDPTGFQSQLAAVERLVALLRGR